MREKLVDLGKIKDLEFVKENRRNLGILNFWHILKNFKDFFFTHFINFRDWFKPI